MGCNATDEDKCSAADQLTLILFAKLLPYSRQVRQALRFATLVAFSGKRR